jgi:hypothetical protein
MTTRYWDHAQQHMECTIHPEEDKELDRSTEFVSGDSKTDHGLK